MIRLTWSGGSLEDLYNKTGDQPESAQARVFVAAMYELRRAKMNGLTFGRSEGLRANVMMRIDRSMTSTITKEMEKLSFSISLVMVEVMLLSIRIITFARKPSERPNVSPFILARRNSYLSLIHISEPTRPY